MDLVFVISGVSFEHSVRVVYDRVRKRNNYFEIPAFLQIERGKSRAGNSKSNEKKNLFLFSFDVLNFPALDFPRSICRKAGISK